MSTTQDQTINGGILDASQGFLHHLQSILGSEQSVFDERHQFGTGLAFHLDVRRELFQSRCICSAPMVPTVPITPTLPVFVALMAARALGE